MQVYTWRAGFVIPGIFIKSRKSFFAKLAAPLVIINIAHKGGGDSQFLSNLLEQTFVDGPLFCLQCLNALYYGPAQLRISPLGLQVRALGNWLAKYSFHDLISNRSAAS